MFFNNFPIFYFVNSDFIHFHPTLTFHRNIHSHRYCKMVPGNLGLIGKSTMYFFHHFLKLFSFLPNGLYSFN